MTRIDDGHSTRIVFTEIRTSDSDHTRLNFTTGGLATGGAVSNIPNGLYMWVREVTPPGMNGGGPNDTSNMHNTLMRTMAPKKLITVTPMQATVSYDPIVLTVVKRLINLNQKIYVVYADYSYHMVWGWLNSFTPGTSKEGSPPEATIEIEPSNQNLTGAEEMPQYHVADLAFPFGATDTVNQGWSTGDG